MRVFRWGEFGVGEQRHWHSLIDIFRFARRRWVLVLCTLGAMGLYAASEGAFLYLMRPFINAFMARGGEGAEAAYRRV